MNACFQTPQIFSTEFMDDDHKVDNKNHVPYLISSYSLKQYFLLTFGQPSGTSITPNGFENNQMDKKECWPSFFIARVNV